jgi:hypothetical protein
VFYVVDQTRSNLEISLPQKKSQKELTIELAVLLYDIYVEYNEGVSVLKV